LRDFFRRGFNRETYSACRADSAAGKTINAFRAFPFFFREGMSLGLAVDGAKVTFDAFLRVYFELHDIPP
jgi:hypothetical protein